MISFIAAAGRIHARFRVMPRLAVHTLAVRSLPVFTSLMIPALMLVSTDVARAQERLLLRHPCGFAMQLPQGWRSTPLDATRYQLMPPDAETGEAIVIVGVPADGVTSVLDPAFIRKSEGDVQAAYPRLRRIGQPEPITTALGPGLRLDFSGVSDGVAVRMSIYLAVKNDRAMTLLAAGGSAQVARRIGALDASFSSLRLDGIEATATTSAGDGLTDGSAAALEWSARLRGQMLTILSGYTSGGSSGGMSARADLTLLHDGRFTYRRSSAVSISVEGLGGSSVGRHSATGSWRIALRGGRATLELRGSDGTREQFVLTRNGTQTFLNGTRAFVTTP
jgi:hypothetical protein